MSRNITKIIEVENRRFKVQKYPAVEGLKIAKVFAAKILPVFQTFVPLIGEAYGGKANMESVMSNLGKYLSLEGISETLDKVTPEDLDYVMNKSLMSVFEVLPAGDAQVMNPDGTYGVLDVEYDPLLVLRLVCEVVVWGVGDFFDVSRLGSIMSPLISSWPQSQRT